MILKSLLLGLLSLSSCGLLACRQVEVRITDAQVEGKEPGEILLRFRLDHDVEDLGNSRSMGYLTVRDQRPSVERTDRVHWHAVATLQEVPGRRTGETLEYVCQFPLTADREGSYYYYGLDGKLASLYVESPYTLTRPGDHSLEFYVACGGCGFFVTGVHSEAVTLTYRRP